MSITFRPAVRENVALLIGLAGGTGSGKTMSAMRMAQGIVGRDKKFAVIDTERGRAKHYAPKHGEEPNFIDTFRFDSADLAEPFSPDAYAEAIMAADKADYRVIVVDSTSHEWEGYGGVLDMQEAELDRMAGTDWKKREAVKMAAWIRPKMAHKKMMQRLLQVKAHLILCFRAAEKSEMIRGDDGKMKVVPKQSLIGLDGWLPISEKNLPYELTASFLLMAAKPGIPHPIKLQEQHRALFPLDKPITEESGKLIAQWASGAQSQPKAAAQQDTERLRGSGHAEPQNVGAPPADAAAPSDDEALLLTAREWAELGTVKYSEWFEKLTAAQQKKIGRKRHDEFWEIAEQAKAA